MNAKVERILVGVAAVLICAKGSLAADLHPIVEVQSGYLFGAISDGKWIKADETAKLIGDETTYRVYGLTQALGDAKGDKPKAVEGRDRAGRSMECIAAQAAGQRYDSTGLLRCGARFFENERDRATKSENREHPSSRFGR